MSAYEGMKIWKEMNFALAPGFFNRCRNFHSPVQDLWTFGKLVLPDRYSNSHTLLGFSLLLSYFSHQQSPAGTAMLTSASKGKKAVTTHGVQLWLVPSPSRDRLQNCISWIRTTLITGCHAGCSASTDESALKNSLVQIISPLHGETEFSSDLPEASDGFVSSTQISGVPALAVLVLCSSPTVFVSGYRPGWIPGVAKAEQSKLHELHRSSLLWPDSHRAWKLVVGVHLSVTELLLCQQIADVVDKELVQPFEILFEGVEYIARAGWTPEGK